MQIIKDCAVLLSLFGQMLFFCICGIVGFSFEGSSSSPLFKLVILGLGTLNIFIVLLDMLMKKIKLKKTFYVFAIFIPMVIIVDFLIEISMPLANKSHYVHDLLFLGAFGLTGVFSSFYISHRGIGAFSKLLEIVMLIVTLSSFCSIIAVTNGGKAGIGGASYQVMSYYSAFCFCLNLCYILFGERLARYTLFKSPIYHVFSYFLLLFQLAGCLLSGGRGGFVLLLTCSVYMLYLSQKVTKTFLVGSLAICLIGSVATLNNDSLFLRKLNGGVNRVFSYVSREGIDMKQTSSRDQVYAKAIEQIEKDQYLGRGLFRANSDFGNYPHNMFLEFIMQGGLLYMLLWLSIILYVAYTVHAKLVTEGDFLIIPILAYPLIMLQFSNSYLYSQFFWFGIVYVLGRSE